MRRLSLLIALLALAGTLAARPVHVRAQPATSLNVTVDRTQVTVGDRIAVSVVARLPAAAQPDLTALEDQLRDGIDVLVIGLPEERAVDGGMKEIRIRYEVAAFRPGGVVVPALTLTFPGQDGAPVAISSAPIPIAVASVLPPGADAADVRDLKPQIDLPFSAGVSTRQLIAVGAFIVTVGAVAALAGWWLWRRRRPAPVVAAPVLAALTPEDVARAELDRIAGLGLLEAGGLEQFHALLAACVRRYLSDRYGFPAYAMTTSELRGRMERLGVGRWQARLTAGLLSECDAVAYARYAPARERAENNLAMAYEVVAAADAVPVAGAGTG